MLKTSGSIFYKKFKLLVDLLSSRSEKKALSVTFGFYLSIFPVLGATTLIGIFTSLIFRLNHYIILVMNVLLAPLQLILMYPFLKIGRVVFFNDSKVLPEIKLKESPFIINWESFTYLFDSLIGGIALWGIISISTGPFLYKLLLNPDFNKAFKEH